MKFDELRSLAHNIADSVASGIGLMVGVYDMDVFGDASRSAEGFVEIDFLAGKVSVENPSAKLINAVELYKQALPGHCIKHGTTQDSFRELRARYYGNGQRFTVTVEDHFGRRATDAYEGVPGKRIRQLDSLGRVRTNRRPVSFS